MDRQVEVIRLFDVKDDVLDIGRRLSALERSHRSLCNSHMDLEDSHGSLNRSYEVVLLGMLKLFEEYLLCVSSSVRATELRFVIPGSGFKSDVDGAAA
jgi:hypothetical protein